MARSFGLAGPKIPQASAQDSSVFHKPSRSSYTVYRRDGAFYLQRRQTGFDGKETNVLEQRVDYVLGSGNHALGLIHRAPDGRLIQLPIAWYEEDRSWSMAPGYDRPNHADFRRAIDGACMFCHNAYPAARIAETPGADLIFPDDLPEGIDCERCHGPGEEHVRLARHGLHTTELRESILNPARLPAERQLEICMQCHLQPTSRLLPSMLRQPRRGTFSYNPREPLASYLLFFDRADLEPSGFEVNHSAYRLRQSACFRSSRGRMVCTTCHNPHEPASAASAERACCSCHAALPRTHSADTRCAGCHMLKRRTDDAVHVVMTDHRITRWLAIPSPLRPKAETHDDSYRGEVRLYYPSAGAGGEYELQVALAQVQDGANLAAGIAWLKRLTEQHPDAPIEYLFGLAEACRNAGQAARAEDLYREVLRRDAWLAPAWLGLGQAIAATGRANETERILEGTLARIPASAPILNLLGSLCQQTGNLGRSAAVLRQAIALAPELPEPHLNLGVTLARQKDLDGAANAFREAIRMAPGLAPAHNNLAYLLASAGRTAEAEFHFVEAIRLDADYFAAHIGYARLLAAAGKREQAAAHFRQAARSPDETMRREALAALQN
jgi:tetratricopeptide (TPR) repeat protein